MKTKENIQIIAFHQTKISFKLKTQPCFLSLNKHLSLFISNAFCIQLFFGILIKGQVSRVDFTKSFKHLNYSRLKKVSFFQQKTSFNKLPSKCTELQLFLATKPTINKMNLGV